MDRAERLQLAKDRALRYLDRGDPTNALASMLSDIKDDAEIGCNEFIAAVGMMRVHDPVGTGSTASIREAVKR